MLSTYKKPSVSDVHAFLRDRKALIVHFSGTPPTGGDFKFQFPNDIKNVLDLGAMTSVSCSLVVPGDNFDHEKGPRDAYGSVGVVLDLTTPQSLATATAGDGGALSFNCKRDFDEGDLDLSDLQDSLDKRDGANEWGVREYQVIGLFVADPVEYWSGGTIVKTDVAFIAKQFPGRRIFTLSDGEIVEILPDGQRVVADIAKIYPPVDD
jgi:hypothetical protein